MAGIGPQPGYGFRPGGTTSKLNLSASTVVKATRGTVYSVNVTTAGSTTGSIHDCTTVGAVSAANLISVIPVGVGPNYVPFPALAGIVFVPGTGMVASISYE